MIEADYQVEKGKNTCSGCGSSFREGQIYMSALNDGCSGELERIDFCSDCWDASDRVFFSFWQSRCRDQGKNSVDVDELFKFYCTLDGKKGDLRSQELKFVLSLYLARKKNFNLIDVQQKNGRDELVLEGPEKGQINRVADPGLSEERIKILNGVINSLFS